MYCRKCGRPNDDNAFKCTSCGEPLQGSGSTTTPKKIDNNLVLAIVVTLLCCLPFGIAGIVFASQVNAKAQAGDIAGAEESARKARMWSLWGLGVGAVVYVLYFIAILAGGLAGIEN
jgi:hypothetical protein